MIQVLLQRVLEGLSDVGASGREPDSIDELPPTVAQIIETPCTSVDEVRSRIENPASRSFQGISAVILTATCWLYLNSSSNQHVLVTAVERENRLEPFFTQRSRRLYREFIRNNDLRWTEFSLAAVALLGDNADARDDWDFLKQVRKVLAKRGQDSAAMFHRFAQVTRGRAKALFERVSNADDK